jgi:hypothetical protein
MDELCEEWKKRLKIIIHFAKNGIVKIAQMTDPQTCHMSQGILHFKPFKNRDTRQCFVVLILADSLGAFENCDRIDQDIENRF